jgi:hypothetical protein
MSCTLHGTSRVTSLISFYLDTLDDEIPTSTQQDNFVPTSRPSIQERQRMMINILDQVLAITNDIESEMGNCDGSK